MIPEHELAGTPRIRGTVALHRGRPPHPDRCHHQQPHEDMMNIATDSIDGSRVQSEPPLPGSSAELAPDAEVESLRTFSDTPTERLMGEPRPGLRYARLTVSDTGHGMTPEILDRMFEPFFSTKGRLRGTGLGLAVVLGVIRSHGGFCHVKSESGKGTTFRVFLPLIEEGVVVAPARSGIGRVLIVDDDMEGADILSIGLERLGYITVAVQKPHQALAAIEEDPEAFDVLLTDQQMPLMSGMDMIREAKRMAPRLRAILYTANLTGTTQAQALAGDVDAVLHKPDEIPAIAEAIKGQLAKKSQ